MSSKPPIGYIDIRVFAHATEDPEKVQTAVRNIIPPETAETLIFEKNNLTGHHGNPIILFTTKLTDKKILPKILENIGSGLNSLNKDEFQNEIKLHIEKGNLYLRLDKQSAYLGKIRFSQNDPIHMRIHFKNKTPEQIIAICREAGLLP